jgi:AcrR family transcriptional regulator
MPRKSAEPGVDRRQQILDAALEIFAEEGFEAATNKAIAERADVNQGLIYFYFASKADVLFATFTYHTDLVIAQLDAIFAQEDASSEAEGLTRLLKQLLQVLTVPPGADLLRIMYQTVGSRMPRGELSNMREGQTFGGLARYLHQHFREYLETRIAGGIFTSLNPVIVTQLLTRTMLASVTLRTQAADRLDLDAFAETIARLYCYGLLPRAKESASEK